MMPRPEISGQVAAATGASSGIGEASELPLIAVFRNIHAVDSKQHKEFSR